MPRTGRTRPSRPSSPIITMSASTRGSIRSAAPSTAQATARSKPEPALGTDAGLSPTVSFFCGHSPPELTTAARTRSRLSVRLLSGSPTSVKAATPGSRSAWTSTTTPSTPTSATEHVRANPMSGHPPRVLDHGGALAGQDHADQVDADPSGWCSSVGLDPALGEVPQPPGLLRRDRGHRMLEPAVPAGLDLADHQDVAVPGDDVDLTCPAAAPVARQDRPSLGFLPWRITSRSRARAGLSISPVLPQRQLRPRPVIPASPSRRAASASPYLPSALRAFMSAPPPVPTVTHPPRRSGSWCVTGRLWTNPSPTRGIRGSPSAARELQVALVQLLDVHVLEREHPHLLDEPGRPVHVPDPGVRHRHLEEDLALDRVHLHLVVVGQIETPLGLDH